MTSNGLWPVCAENLGLGGQRRPLRGTVPRLKNFNCLSRVMFWVLYNCPVARRLNHILGLHTWIYLDPEPSFQELAIRLISALTKPISLVVCRWETESPC